MKIKTCELNGKALDFAVALLEGATYSRDFDEPVIEWTEKFDTPLRLYSPSTNWAQGGPIIEREKYTITFSDNDWYTGWVAATQLPSAYVSVEGTYIADCLQGSTPLEAAMRLLVARKLGPEVEIPGELL